MVHIEVLGLGCPKCATLARRAEEAARRLGLDFRFDKVTDLERIIETGAAVPALIVDGRVLSAGLSPAPAEVERLLRDAAACAEATPSGVGAMEES